MYSSNAAQLTQRNNHPTEQTIESIMQDSRTTISTPPKSEEDRVLLEEMLEVLREIQRTGKPCKETGLARFYELVKKTEDLSLPLLKFFFGIFS